MSTKIHVLMLVSGLAVEGASGGAGRFGMALCQALQNESCGIQPALFSLWHYGTPAEHQRAAELKASGVETFFGSYWDEAHPYRSFWRALQTFQAQSTPGQFDILHSHSEFADLAALWLKLGHLAPIAIRTAHNHEWRKRPLRRILFSQLLFPLMFRREFAVSRYLTGRLNARMLARLLRQPAVYLPNAIRLATDKAQPSQRPKDWPVNARMLAAIGRLTPQKGFDVLLTALPDVISRLPDVQLVLIGEGELRAQLEAQATANGLAERVRFSGAQADAIRILQHCDLLVSPSRWEGLPTVVLEALANGIPVVASGIPGTREVIQHGHNGMLVPPNNPTALAKGILALLQNPALSAQFSAQGRADVQKFSMEKIACRQAEFYHQLKSGSASTSRTASSSSA